MKFSELPIINLRDVQDDDAYMICNVVDHDQENVNHVSKSLLHISNFAHKEEINTLVEQNSKLVAMVTALINKTKNIEEEISKLGNELNNIKNDISNNKPQASEDIEKVNLMIDELTRRLDENLIEY